MFMTSRYAISCQQTAAMQQACMSKAKLRRNSKAGAMTPAVAHYDKGCSRNSIECYQPLMPTQLLLSNEQLETWPRGISVNKHAFHCNSRLLTQTYIHCRHISACHTDACGLRFKQFSTFLPFGAELLMQMKTLVKQRPVMMAL